MAVGPTGLCGSYRLNSYRDGVLISVLFAELGGAATELGYEDVQTGSVTTSARLEGRQNCFEDGEQGSVRLREKRSGTVRKEAFAGN